ncbi:hypothetical protein JCM10512_1678 [Bacteroides reticulotermitis JCM 10512]|uniref:Uncharacterized protein n=1 Tax=Bacteroides reticulotermitis JCM 10512 TaxID=1445607 RepID=W4US22_9BACE|nr:hypothetical protein JCM10512_1678 [Bacteroides reticulotermitis JCM 10512]
MDFQKISIRYLLQSSKTLGEEPPSPVHDASVWSYLVLLINNSSLYNWSNVNH